MTNALLHPVIGDHPMFWVIVAGFLALVVAAVYIVIRLVARRLSRGRMK
ncbi:MAG TPA: hypothetical protein VFX96_12925 [Pyrinomonadaceae bacterium]|nr:hypothetical protein [Pyrinomonadaceae bacterium]